MIKEKLQMNKVTNVELIEEVVVITTEGYLNKDLGEDIQNSVGTYSKWKK